MMVQEKTIVCLSICDLCTKRFSCDIDVCELIKCINSYEDKFYGKSTIKSEKFLDYNM